MVKEDTKFSKDEEAQKKIAEIIYNVRHPYTESGHISWWLAAHSNAVSREVREGKILL